VANLNIVGLAAGALLGDALGLWLTCSTSMMVMGGAPTVPGGTPPAEAAPEQVVSGT